MNLEKRESSETLLNIIQRMIAESDHELQPSEGASDMSDKEDNRAFLEFKNIIQSVHADNGGIKGPELTEPRLFLEKMQAMANNRFIQKDKLIDRKFNEGWEVHDLVNFGASSKKFLVSRMNITNTKKQNTLSSRVQRAAK
jgi:hypothetical protein